jgi:hypothetical protein
LSRFNSAENSAKRRDQIFHPTFDAVPQKLGAKKRQCLSLREPVPVGQTSRDTERQGLPHLQIILQIGTGHVPVPKWALGGQMVGGRRRHYIANKKMPRGEPG